MSEVLAQLEKKGGGGMSEKVLWTNSAPTSNFAGQTVTLLEEITNYDFIRIYSNISRSSPIETSTLMSVSDYLTITTSVNEPRFMFGGNSTSTANFFRMARCGDTNDKVVITTAYNSSGSSANDQIIPTKICGCKL